MSTQRNAALFTALVALQPSLRPIVVQVGATGLQLHASSYRPLHTAHAAHATPGFMLNVTDMPRRNVLDCRFCAVTHANHANLRSNPCQPYQVQSFVQANLIESLALCMGEQINHLSACTAAFLALQLASILRPAPSSSSAVALQYGNDSVPSFPFDSGAQ